MNSIEFNPVPERGVLHPSYSLVNRERLTIRCDDRELGTPVFLVLKFEVLPFAGSFWRSLLPGDSERVNKGILVPTKFNGTI